MWIFLFVSSAFALFDETQKMGPTAGMAGAGSVLDRGGSYAAYYNPASMLLPEGKRFGLSFALVGFNSSFKPIENIVIENTATADSVAMGSVSTVYPATVGSVLGVMWQAFDWQRVTVGLVAFFPLKEIAVLQTLDAYQPVYMLYRTRGQRPQIHMGISGALTEHLSFGLGVAGGFSLTSRANVFMNTRSLSASKMSFGSTLLPKAAPFFGFYWDAGAIKTGIVGRVPLNTDNTLQLISNVKVATSSFPFDFISRSSLFYDPATIEYAISYKRGQVRLLSQLDCQFWAPAPSMSLDVEPLAQGASFQPGTPPSMEYRTIIIPRLGLEMQITDHTVLRAGYAYRPSILMRLPLGNGNYLDPNVHMVHAGSSITYGDYSFDASLFYHVLVISQITKTPLDEMEQPGQKVGSPSYMAGGGVFGVSIGISILL